MDYFIKMNLVLTAFYGLYRLAFRRSAYFAVNRAFLLSGLAMAFLVPALDLFPGNYFSTVPELPSAGGIFSAFSISETPGTASSEDAASPESEVRPVALAPVSIVAGDPQPAYFYLFRWAKLGYWAVSALFLLKAIFFLCQLFQFYRKNHVIKREGYQLVLLKNPQEPAFSFFSLIFINAADLGRQDHWILRHELVHVRQFHSIDILLSEAVKIILWINPFAHLYQHALRSVHEYLADSVVPPEEKSAYARLMYDYSFRSSRLALQNSFFRNKTLLKRRISMLYQKKTPKMRAAYLLVLPLLAVLGAFASGGQPKSSVTVEANPSVNAGLELKGLPLPGAQPDFITVSGTVADASGQPLAGVSIFVKETRGGTATGLNGHFELGNVPSDAQLQFSMIGYENQLVTLSNNRTVNVRLRRKRERLKEMALVAYASKPDPKARTKTEAEQPATEANEHANGQNGKVYAFASIEKMPQFPGGNDKLISYIARRFRFPAKARDNDVEGIIEIGFIVDEKGKVTDPEILRGIGSGCDEEALRVIKSLPQWEPGEQNGVKVPVYYVQALNVKVN